VCRTPPQHNQRRMTLPDNDDIHPREDAEDPITPQESTAEEHTTESPADPPRPKRNCGRTGATTQAGRARSALNAVRHGSCAWTLILPTESEEGWQLLLARWRKRYPCEDDSVEYDFLLKATQAEWHRIRCQNNFNSFLSTTVGVTPFNWTEEQKKNHDLHLRYKTAADREFRSAYHLLQNAFKSQPPPPAPAPTADPKPAPEPKRETISRFIICDPKSPTGFSVDFEYPPQEGVTYPYPIPRPPNYPGLPPLPPTDPKGSETG
jgi:hypothetical protein